MDAPRLKLRLFGHMSVDDTTGGAFLPRTRKTRALFAVLALASPRPLLRMHLAGLLWSRRETEQARASLRQSVHELQETLGTTWGHLFVTDRHHLTIRGPGMEVDALLAAQSRGDGPDNLNLFHEVLLEDLTGLDPAFDKWLEDERARFTRIGRSVAEGLMAKCDNARAAIDAAERLLAIDRRHEGAYRTMMRSQADLGDPTAALTSYERLRGILAEEGQTQPSPETEELARAIRERRRTGGMPASSASMPRVSAPDPSPAVSRGVPRERSAPRLRVAPFRVIGAGPDDGLATGLGEEVSAGLSRFRWISCVPPTLWPSDANPNGLSAEAMARLGADLVLDGTIQYGANRVRILVRLLDIRAGGEIAWAGRFDRSQTDPLTMQDEVGAAIVAQVDPELMQHEGRRAANLPSTEINGQDLMLMALPSIYRMERASFNDAHRLLELSLKTEPSNPFVHGWMAYWHVFHVGQGWSPNPELAAAEASRLADRALTLDPADARALTLAGHIRGFLGKQPREAAALHERAIALNPNLAIAWCFSGLSYAYMGDHREAQRRIEQAIQLSPSDPHAFFFHMALTMPLNMTGDYDNAITAGRRAVELNPLFSSSYKGYLLALGLAGRRKEAQDILQRLLALEPGFSVEEALMRSPLTRPEDMARYAEGLRRAGLPEQGGVPDKRQLALRISQTAIDLVPEAQHSPLTHHNDRGESHSGTIG